MVRVRLLAVIQIFLLASCTLTLPAVQEKDVAQGPAAILVAPVPTGTPPPGVEDSSLDSELWSKLTDRRHGVTYQYPDSWYMVTPSGSQVGELLQAVEDAAVDDLSEMIGPLAASPEQLLIFSALGFLPGEIGSSDPAYMSNLAAMAMPVDGLGLASYAELVHKQLDALPHVRVQEAEVVRGLRSQGRQVVSLRYALAGDLYGLPDLDLVGWQVVLLDERGERFLIVTFTSLSQEFSKLEPDFAEFIRRIQFETR